MPDPTAGRRFRPRWRPPWTGPLLVCVLYIVHWGVLTAYLPQRAEGAGADVGLFFTGDAVTLLLMRIPGGYLVNHYGTKLPTVIGLTITTASLGFLLLPLTTPLLILAGAGTGLGAALVIPSILIGLSHRSADADRGSAFGLYGVAFGGGIAIGSIGTAPLVGLLGYHLLLGAAMACCLAGIAVAIWDARVSAGSEPSGTLEAAPSYDEASEVLPT